MDLENARNIAQIAAPVAVTFSALVALWLGLRNRKPRFQVAVAIKDPHARGRSPNYQIYVRNFGTLPVRVKGLFVTGSEHGGLIPWPKSTRDFAFRSHIWVIQPGDEETADLQALSGDTYGAFWGNWVVTRPKWFRYSFQVAQLFWYVGVITTDGRRTKARATREAIKALRDTEKESR